MRRRKKKRKRRRRKKKKKKKKKGERPEEGKHLLARCSRSVTQEDDEVQLVLLLLFLGLRHLCLPVVRGGKVTRQTVMMKSRPPFLVRPRTMKMMMMKMMKMMMKMMKKKRKMKEIKKKKKKKKMKPSKDTDLYHHPPSL